MKLPRRLVLHHDTLHACTAVPVHTVEGGSAIIPTIYGTSTVLFYRTRSSTVRTTGTVLVRYSCTGTGILLHWDSGSFWVEMSGAVVQTAQFAQATARELDQISPNPTVGR